MKMTKSKHSPFVPRLRRWKLKEPDFKAEFERICTVKLDALDVTQGDVSTIWNHLKKSLLETALTTCGKTKKPLMKRETWWWDEEVKELINEKRRKWKIWRNGGDKEEYNIAKRIAKRAVYKAKKNAEAKKFADLKPGLADIFKIAKQMRKDNQDVLGDKCVRNDTGNLATSDVAKCVAWKEHYSRLLNVEFPWDSNSLVAEPIAGVPLYISTELVNKAVAKMKPGKAAGPSGITSEMLKSSGNAGSIMIANLLNAIIRDGVVPSDWESSFIINLYKGKGDALERGNYRGLKLLDHVMKTTERIIENIIRDRINIDEMQFGFVPGRGTSDAIFILRQLQDKHIAKSKVLYFAFIDLEKAFDRVPRKVIWWAMRKLGLDEWIISLVKSMYVNTKSKVRVNDIFTDEFDVKVGVHQGSVLSPLLFIIVLEALSSEFRIGTPWELLYADDLVLVAVTEEELRRKVDNWKEKLEIKGLRVNVLKTKVMVSGKNMGSLKDSGKFPCGVCRKGVGSNSIFCVGCSLWIHKKCSKISGTLVPDPTFRCNRCKGLERPITGNANKNFQLSNGAVLDIVDSFCYLGDTLDAGGGCEASITARVRAAWGKFRQLLPLLTSRGLSQTTRGKIYNTYIRPVLLYASESWAPTVSNIAKLQRNDRSMTRWICNIKLSDNISSSSILEKLGIADISLSISRNRLRWFGHVYRSTGSINDVMNLAIDGSRGRGRPKKTWADCVKADKKKWRMAGIDPSDRDLWRKALLKTPQTVQPPGRGSEAR